MLLQLDLQMNSGHNAVVLLHHSKTGVWNINCLPVPDVDSHLQYIKISVSVLLVLPL